MKEKLRSELAEIGVKQIDLCLAGDKQLLRLAIDHFRVTENLRSAGWIVRAIAQPVLYGLVERDPPFNADLYGRWRPPGDSALIRRPKALGPTVEQLAAQAAAKAKTAAEWAERELAAANLRAEIAAGEQAWGALDECRQAEIRAAVLAELPALAALPTSLLRKCQARALAEMEPR